MNAEKVPDIATDAVLVRSEQMPEDAKIVKGYDFNAGLDHHALLHSFLHSGFQATNFGLAVEQINAMIKKREEPLGKDEDASAQEYPKNNCAIFLGRVGSIFKKLELGIGYPSCGGT